MHDSYWAFHRDQFLELLPPPGRLTVDVGAGEGRLPRDLVARGHRVVALDASAAMVAAARAADAIVPVVQADAARLPLANEVADLVVAFMSLQDFDDMDAAVREAARVLAPGGRFCFAVVHPINSAGLFAGREPDDPFVIQGSYLDEARYEERLERDGREMSFASVHRPVEGYFDALARPGLLVERLREPRVPDDAIEAPNDRRWQRVPLFLHVAAVKR
ncbi:MAG TPA: class I SAM-dependent methyltransferase [Actinomycetota bacterium]|nr:class I SAM-dependent methyltransferase [Actinomycetota bacterium]